MLRLVVEPELTNTGYSCFKRGVTAVRSRGDTQEAAIGAWVLQHGSGNGIELVGLEDQNVQTALQYWLVTYSWVGESRSRVTTQQLHAGTMADWISSASRQPESWCLLNQVSLTLEEFTTLEASGEI